MSSCQPASERGYRILYHHRTQALDGQRVHIREIQQSLRTLGHHVLEVAPLAGGEQAGARPSPSVQRRVLQAIAEWTPAGAYELIELAYNIPGYRRLVSAIRDFRPDFIYERYSLNAMAGVRAARQFGIPLLLEVNSPLADEKKSLRKLRLYRTARRIERYVITRSTQTLAVSNVLLDLLVTANGIAADQVTVIHNGADRQRFTVADRERNEARSALGVGSHTVIGAVGFFREWHGIDLLLKALHRDITIRRNSRVVLVGDGPALPSLREMVRALELQDHVIFLGSVPHDKVPALVAAIDVALIPRAAQYASPLKLFEYMAAGRAIVAPRQPNIEEIVTDGVDSLLFSRENEGELGTALERVISSPALRQELGQAALRTVERNELTWDGNAARIVRAFEKLGRAIPVPQAQGFRA